MFRLKSFEIELPPLKTRRGDIQHLVFHHVARICERNSIPIKAISPTLLEALLKYGWPGNVRELVNALERAMAVARDDPVLFAKHLPDEIRIKLASPMIEESAVIQTASESMLSETSGGLPPIKDYRMSAEQQYLRQLLEESEGDLSRASSISGLSQPRLYAILRKHGLKRA